MDKEKMMIDDCKRALVTGGAGFIGSHLVEALAGKGIQVHVLDNFSTGDPSNIEFLGKQGTVFEGDIRDEKIVLEAAQNCELVFHLAAIVSVPQSIADPIEAAHVNEIGSLHVLRSARQAGVKRVVFASSCAVYGDDPRLPKNEGMHPKPCSPYAVQKLSVEHYARLYCELYGIETLALRYFNVYGPRQDPSSPYSGVISIFMSKAAAAQTPVIYGDGNQSRDFIYVKDVVEANMLAASAPRARGQTINVGTGRSISIQQLWSEICIISGFSRVPDYQPARAGDILESLADTGRMHSVLRFTPGYSLSAGLRSTFDWYQGQSRMAAGRSERKKM